MFTDKKGSDEKMRKTYKDLGHIPLPQLPLIRASHEVGLLQYWTHALSLALRYKADRPSIHLSVVNHEKYILLHGFIFKPGTRWNNHRISSSFCSENQTRISNVLPARLSNGLVAHLTLD